MADLNSVKLHIAGIGHAFYAQVGTAVPKLDNFKFGDSSTYGGFKWLGDISAENLVEFEREGGEATFKRTHDRMNVRAVYDATSYTGTINSLNIDRETFEIAFSGGEYVTETDSYKVKSKTISKSMALLLVFEDGISIAGLSLPAVDITGSMPVFSVEEFTELPLNLALKADTDGTLWEHFFPRDYTPAQS